MAASTCLHSPFLKNPPSPPLLKPSSSSQLFTINVNNNTPRKPNFKAQSKKKKVNPWLNPFYEELDPEQEYGSLYVDGKQDEDPTPPDNPGNPYGFLKFPMGYAVEIASLGSKIRGDVRRCCCMISGGVYENLLFFPVIQLIKDRYPGVQVDVITSERGKQVYEMNKNVRWTNVYDIDDDFPDPAEYTDMLGVIKNRYYDMVLSTRLAGLGHAAFLFMSTARDRVSYIYPNVNSAGAGLLLSETFTPDSSILSEGGYNMYDQMAYWLGRPFRSVPRHDVAPLKVLISRKLKEAVADKYTKAGVEKGKYIVIHGIQSDSKASMQSTGDPDSLLSIEILAEIADSIRGFEPLFVIPHEKERENVEEIYYYAKMVFITTPGQLAALINDSAGVIATNTAAVQLANARKKPCIALFGSEEKAKKFVPNSEEKNCTIISSKTGTLVDIDVEAVKTSFPIFDMSLALV